jgi:hypothetical protein
MDLSAIGEKDTHRSDKKKTSKRARETFDGDKVRILLY